MHMSYYKITEWNIIPDGSPQIYRNCSKCGCKSSYSNTHNFRVNANGNNVDVWLIYQCIKCKTTYNLTIYERIKPSKIPKEEYKKYLSNDRELATAYGLNIDIFRKNKADVNLDQMEYGIVVKENNRQGQQEKDSLIIIRNPYKLKLRLDKVLAKQLVLSRSKVRKLIADGYIYSLNNEKLDKLYITNDIEIKIQIQMID